MPYVIVCPACQKSLQVPDDLLGKYVRCPECMDHFQANTPEMLNRGFASNPLPPAGRSEPAEAPRSGPAPPPAPEWFDDDRDDDRYRRRRRRPRYDDRYDDDYDRPRLAPSQGST